MLNHTQIYKVSHKLLFNPRIFVFLFNVSTGLTADLMTSSLTCKSSVVDMKTYLQDKVVNFIIHLILTNSKSFDSKWRLSLSWRRPLSYRNQSTDLRKKSMDWFLYDNDLHHEKVKLRNSGHIIVRKIKTIKPTFFVSEYFW